MTARQNPPPIVWPSAAFLLRLLAVVLIAVVVVLDVIGGQSARLVEGLRDGAFLSFFLSFLV